VALALAIVVTALPVLAAILGELGLIAMRLGQWALTLTAANDAALWLALAVLLGVASGVQSAWIVVPGTLVYAAIMAWAVPPVLRSAAGCGLGRLGLLAVGIVALALSAAATGALGLHAMLGAFVAGVALPPAYRTAIPPLIERGVTVLLLPFFSLSTGLKTVINLGDGPNGRSGDVGSSPRRQGPRRRVACECGGRAVAVPLWHWVP
jgi:Kef-type K+ transport system membrane component KefB